MSAGRAAPPKKRTFIRVPLVANVSRFFIPSQIAPRVFSGAHTAVSEPGFKSFPSAQPPTPPSRRLSTEPSSGPCPPFQSLSSTSDGRPLWLSVPPTKPSL